MAGSFGLTGCWSFYPFKILGGYGDGDDDTVSGYNPGMLVDESAGMGAYVPGTVGDVGEYIPGMVGGDDDMYGQFDDGPASALTNVPACYTAGPLAQIQGDLMCGDDGEDALLSFDPREVTGVDLPPLGRPRFLAIISSHVLAATLLKKANGVVDGFVVEHHIAGGHNAPPREGGHDANGEPVYGERDVVDYSIGAVMDVVKRYNVDGVHFDDVTLVERRFCPSFDF